MKQNKSVKMTKEQQVLGNIPHLWPWFMRILSGPTLKKILTADKGKLARAYTTVSCYILFFTALSFQKDEQTLFMIHSVSLCKSNFSLTLPATFLFLQNSVSTVQPKVIGFYYISSSRIYWTCGDFLFLSHLIRCCIVLKDCTNFTHSFFLLSSLFISVFLLFALWLIWKWGSCRILSGCT